MHQKTRGIAVLAVLSLTVSAGISQAKPEAGVTYKAAPEARLRYSDGVTVHRHADGSVEVSDPDTVQTQYPASRPVKRMVKHRAAVKKTTRSKSK